ncbi:MAG: methyltransferase domain-containing protein [Myxococcales bacterium]|nr:methyltransferase domain-containing protein [Myxococcales bacterium]
MTARLLADAGISAGARALDIGCAHGDLTLELARMVGPRGAALGIDRNASAIARAQARAAELGLTNVDFAVAELAALSLRRGPFDVIVGRRVLMYLPDPVAVLRRLAEELRPGGRMVFQEHDASMVPASSVPLPLHERVHRVIWETVAREGGNLRMGLTLADTLTQAGLIVEEVRAEAIVQTPRTRHPTAMIVRAMLPRIVAHGVATAAELEVETLAERLAEERARTGATYVGDMVFGAWARRPG